MDSLMKTISTALKTIRSLTFGFRVTVAYQHMGGVNRTHLPLQVCCIELSYDDCVLSEYQ